MKSTIRAALGLVGGLATEDLGDIPVGLGPQSV